MTDKITKENVKKYFPCWGHFWINNCWNEGYRGPNLGGHCPVIHSCKQETNKFKIRQKENMDFDKPHLVRTSSAKPTIHEEEQRRKEMRSAERR